MHSPPTCLHQLQQQAQQALLTGQGQGLLKVLLRASLQQVPQRGIIPAAGQRPEMIPMCFRTSALLMCAAVDALCV
jgi:hypothetical protein